MRDLSRTAIMLFQIVISNFSILSEANKSGFTLTLKSPIEE